MRKAINIQWDVYEEEGHIPLPTEVIIPDDIEDDKISDYISDTVGFCHYGFELVEGEDDRTIIEATSTNDAIHKILPIYREEDICIGELMEIIEIHGLSMHEVVTVWARLYKEIEGDIVTRTDEYGSVNEIIGE